MANPFTRSAASSSSPKRKAQARFELPVNYVAGTDAARYEHLPFAMSLKGYLDGTGIKRFAFGHWLETLDNHRLDELLQTYRTFSTTPVGDVDNRDVLNDMLTLLMTVIAREKGKKSLTEKTKRMPTYIDSMGVCIRIETWKRKGWVTVEGDLTVIQRKPASVFPTEKMRDEDPALYAKLSEG